MRRPPGIGRRKGFRGAGGAVPFSPTQIPDLGLWLRSDNVVTSGSDVTTWTDLSGNNNDASGGVSPSYNTADAALNGRPTVEFNGSTQYLVASDSATLRITDSGLEVHVVGRWTSSIGNEDFLVKSNVDIPYLMRKTNADAFRCLIRNAANLAYYDNTDVAPTLGDGTSRLATMRYNGTDTMTISVDDSAAVTDTDTGYLSPETNDLGLGARPTAAQFAACAMAEVVLYQRELTATERAKLVAYFESRYGVF